jgi:hypothetical protein
MPTATENLVDAIIAGLKTGLPVLLTDAGLDAPTADDKGYSYGEPELKPTSRTPYLSVDISGSGQTPYSIGGGVERNVRALIYAFISGPDPQTVARDLHRWADCLVSAIEGLTLTDVTQHVVSDVDFSPNLRGGNVLFRGVMVEVTITVHRARASVP